MTILKAYDMDDFEKFYNIALRFLSYRPRSEKEVRDHLKLKASHFAKASRDKQNSKLIDQVIQKLKEYRFIDDVGFAKKWIEERMQFKPRSLRLITLELKRKGISEEIIESIIHDSQFMIQNDLEQAKRLVEKRMNRSFGKLGMTPEKEYQKLVRFLASKGFDWDTIKKAIDESLEKGV